MYIAAWNIFTFILTDFSVMDSKMYHMKIVCQKIHLKKFLFKKKKEL